MSSTKPQIPDTETTDVEPDNDNDGLIPTGGLGISKRQTFLLIGLVVVAALIMWRLRQDRDDNGGGGQAAEEFKKAVQEDIEGEVEITDRDGDGNPEIEVPINPADELEKDEAVIEALKASGKMEGAS